MRRWSSFGLVLQLLALIALPRLLSLASTPFVHDMFDGPEVGLALLPVTIALLLFATGRALVRGTYAVPLVAAYTVASLVLAIAAAIVLGKDEPSTFAVAGLLADPLAGPAVILIGLALFPRRAESSPRAEAGAIVLAFGASGIVAEGFQLVELLHYRPHTLGNWIGALSAPALMLVADVLGVRAGWHLLAGTDRARSALRLYVIARVILIVGFTVVAVIVDVVEDFPFRYVLPAQLAGLVGILTPLVIWWHVHDWTPAPRHLGVPALAQLAWWFAVASCVRAIILVDAQEPLSLVMVVIAAATATAAAALAGRELRGARAIAAVSAAAFAMLAILAARQRLADSWRAPQISWWQITLPLVTCALLAWLTRVSRS